MTRSPERRHTSKIRGDTPGMFRHALAVLTGAAAAAVIVACSSPTDAKEPAKTVTKTAETSVVTSAAPRPSGATIDACRSLATDKPLAEFWHEVAHSPTVSGTLAMLAGNAVMSLGRYTTNPDVDPDVLLTMADSVDQMGDMNQEIANGTAQFDIDRFKGIITPVVTVCEDAGVDMTVS